MELKLIKIEMIINNNNLKVELKSDDNKYSMYDSGKNASEPSRMETFLQISKVSLKYFLNEDRQ